jgi:hypothetical protein
VSTCGDTKGVTVARIKRKRGRWSILAGTLFTAALLLAIAGGGAFGASVSSASFSGGAGTVSVSDTLYAEEGGALTLTVNTANNTRCVDVTGAHTARQTSASARTSWTFSFTAGSGDGGKQVNITVGEGSNNNGCTTRTATANASYVLDNTGPTVTASSITPATNAAGWRNSNVSMTWSASDSGSGVASGPTPATDSQTANTSGVTKSSTASDRLGNVGNGSVVIKLDKETPTISASRNPAANANGWNNSDVTVSFACSDGVSGIKSCSAPVVVSSDGANQPVNGNAVDNADNTASTSVNVSIDRVAPTLSGAPTTSPNAAGWYKSNVSIAWTCADALSGIHGSCPANSVISSEGTGLTASAGVSDRAGNSTNATSSPAVKIDKTAPVTNASAPPAWNNVDVSVDLNASDGLSDVAATYYKIDNGATQTYSAFTQPSFSAEGVYDLEYWSVDKAGNEEAHHAIPVRIDKTPPTIQANKSPAANANGWHKSNVIVSFVCSDELSGIASCSPSEVVSSEGAGQQVSGTAVDNAGNSATGHAFVSLDKTAPTIGANRSPAPNAHGWNNSDVTVSFSCGDLLSGIDICPAPQTLGEGANQSASGTAIDNAGNSASAAIGGISIDKAPPNLSGSATPAPNGNGWRNGDVTVAWTCSDALSGIDGSCPADETLIGEGSNLSASASVSDKAGNSKNATVSGIKIDRTAPVTQIDLPAPAADDWYAGPVQVTLNRSDSLSGVNVTRYSIDNGASQTYSGPFTFDQNGVHTIRFWSEDKAGNVEDSSIPGHEATIKIDTVNPSISADRAPVANGFGWNNGPVTVGFSCSDADSGIRVSPPGCPAAVVLSSEGAGQSAGGTAYDRVGNHASSGVSGINIDLTAPSVSGQATTSPNANGWYKDDVTIAWVAEDLLSDVDPSTLPANSTIGGEGSNLGAGPVSVFDKAGNEGQGSVSGIKIDRTAPSVSFASPADGASVATDGVTVTVNASDGLSGIDGVSINGGAAAKNADGSFSRVVPLACGVNSLIAVATDKAGHASQQASRSVNRSCHTADYLAPLDASSSSGIVQNTVKYSRVVPVKVHVLNGAGIAQGGADIAAPTIQVGRLAGCTASTTDVIEESYDAGSANNNSSSFRWDSTAQQWIYNLDTKAMNLSTSYCFRIDVKLDGNVISSSKWAVLKTLK